MEITKIGPIGLAGHQYFVLVEHGIKNGELIYNILQTECLGRWAMSDCAIGDSWIDKQLINAVEDYFNC